MNGWPIANLTSLESGLVIAEGITLLILLSLVFYFKGVIRRVKKDHPSFWTSDQLRRWGRESEALCLDLSKTLEEKKAITQRLLEQLDEKIRSLHSSLEEIEEKRRSIGAGEKEADLHGEVVKMVEAGYQFPEIVRSLKVPKGEVQLILDLKQYIQ
jgi:hypothetical protein